MPDRAPPKHRAARTKDLGLSEAIDAMIGLETALRNAPVGSPEGVLAELTRIGTVGADTARMVEELQAQYPSGAMLIDARGRIVAVTDALSRLFDLDIGANIFEHEWDGDVRSLVRKSVKGLSKSLKGNTELVQLSSEGNARLAAIEPYTNRTGPLLLFRLVGQPWHEAIGAQLRTTFALSETEVELARCLYLGMRSREIAETRERSIDTVRTQIKALLRKTNLHSQSALISMVASLSLEVRPAELSEGIEVIRDRDGTLLRFCSYGDPAGRPVLMFHASSDPYPGKRHAEMFRSAGLHIFSPLHDDARTTGTRGRMMDERTRTARALLQALAIPSCAVAGYREGGIYAAHFASQHPECATGVLAIDMTIPTGDYEGAELPAGVSAFLASIRSFPFAAEMAFRLLRRLMDSSEAGMNYFLDLMNREDPASQRDCTDPEIREIVIRNYRFTYRDCGLLVRHAGFWYSDWSEVAEQLRAQMPLRFLQGDANCMLPVGPLRAYCDTHTNASSRVVEGAGQLLLYSHTPAVIEELRATVEG